MFDLYSLPLDIQEKIIEKNYNIDKVIDNIDNLISIIEFNIKFYMDNIDYMNDMKNIFYNNSTIKELNKKIVDYEEKIIYLWYQYEILSNDFLENLFDSIDDIDEINEYLE